MELPIQLKFFKKLELYQELKFQNKKIIENNDLESAWKTEKEILKWTVLNHHYLQNGITHEFIRNNILKIEQSKNPKETAKIYNKSLTLTFGNLANRGYGKLSTQRGDEIFFEKEGLLMGEVIYDIEGKNIWNRLKYPFLYYLTWFTAIFGAFIVIINFVNLFTDIILDLYSIIQTRN